MKFVELKTFLKMRDEDELSRILGVLHEAGFVNRAVRNNIRIIEILDRANQWHEKFLRKGEKR